MKLYQEMRILKIMLASTVISLIGMIGLALAGLVYNEWLYLIGAGVLLAIVSVISSIGAKRTQQLMIRMKKIREGGGDEADLEWLKTSQQ